VSTTDALIALAQFALTLAGFSGALVAFVGRDGSWHAADSFRTRRAIATSAGVAFLAMAAVALQMAGVIGGALWRASSALAGAFGVLWLAGDAPRYRRERRALRGVVPIWGTYAVYASAAAISGVHAWNALCGASAGVYFGAQLYTLLLPAVVFARVPFVRPEAASLEETPRLPARWRSRMEPRRSPLGAALARERDA
jgi:hypothetical protein